jgi:hypothetical protein
VLALTVSWMCDRRSKDSGGANHHYKTCKEITIKETSKQIFLYSTLKWQLLEWLVKVWKGEEGKWKVVSPFSFFKFLLFIFEFFLILSNAKVSKNKYAVETEKRKWWIWGWEKKSKYKWWKKGGKVNRIATGLPPGESFTFLVCKQGCLNTFED